MLIKLLKRMLGAPALAAQARREQQVLPVLESAAAAYKAGRFEEAVSLCRDALSREPRSAQANHLCARALIKLDRKADAEPLLQAAIDNGQAPVEACLDLAALRYEADDHAAAEKICRKGLASRPADVPCRLLLASTLEASGRGRDAVVELTAAREQSPERMDLLIRLCMLLDRQERHAEMLKLAERAVAEHGEQVESLNCLALARFRTDDLKGAVEACRKALALRADASATHVTLGAALLELGEAEEALSAYRRALKLDPQLADAEYNIGLINLMRGRFRAGWEGFDRRFGLERHRLWRQAVPRWNGGSLRGRSIMIMREQGLGDEIMFASCFPEVIRQTAQCFVECDPRLERLFARSFPGARFFPIRDFDTREQTDAGVAVDVRSYAGSLPRYLRTGLRDFPAHQGYLQADPAKVERRKALLSELGPGLKVGLSWRGGTAVTRRDRRSLDLQQLLPLLSVPGIHWVNLQYGDRQAEIAALDRRHGIVLHDWPEVIDSDCDETAALVVGLDLVISVCTAVVHLTGALGRPVWVMTSQVPEWRYGLSGDTMPWYPTAKLFRQTARGDWDGVISEVSKQLQAGVERHEN